MTEDPRSRTPQPIQRLLFRRQFLLGPREFAPNDYWSCIRLPQGLYLSVHSDLPVTSASDESVTVTLLGHVVDPNDPERTEPGIVHSLMASASELSSLIYSTMPLVGRWIVIFQNGQGTFLFTDPCGFRQVYYNTDGDQVWCASQPELIKANHPMSLNTDDVLWRFLTGRDYVRHESAWIGPRTLYENCLHLLPNHYLSVLHRQQSRFYPSERIPCDAVPSLLGKDTAQIVECACAILQGTMTSLTARYNVTQALTSGWDSRILLAASRHVSQRIQYFVFRPANLGESHPDVWVPKRMAKKLGINFVVKSPADQLPGWFISMLSQNVTCARVLPKTFNIYQKFIENEDRININGNASGIFRNFFDTYCQLDPRELSAAKLATLMDGDRALPSFAVRELGEWKEGLDRELLGSPNLLDLVYWEHRLGNWGAHYPAEQDIAVEEISPFNCRLLINTLLSADRTLRAAPDWKLFRELIQHMWPEALSFPINPGPRRDVVGGLKRRIRRYTPVPIVRMAKRLFSGSLTGHGA